MLNIPISLVETLREKNNILIAGIGGEFDIYGGIPLYYTLQKLGKQIVLANYSFTDFNTAIQNGASIINPNLLIANNEFENSAIYYPEGHLSKFFKVGLGQDVPVYMFAKTGSNPLKKSFQYIIDTHNIDFIFLVDGGVNSLNTGAETGHGTLIEDSITMAAVSQISIKKIIMCIGFGAEVEKKVSGYNVLMNISNIIKNNGFIGSCSLTKDMNSYKLYKNACMFAFTQQEFQKTSDIHRRILPATEGEFGDYHLTNEDIEKDIFISALMSICWFFHYDCVFIYNKIIPHVSDSESFFDSVQSAMPFIQSENIKIPHNLIPY
mgnify:CR=1 FL=1|jgi:hypothetical protein